LRLIEGLSAKSSASHDVEEEPIRRANRLFAEVALEARGVQHLSLRELSRKLGVSHASPQRHFATKQDLIDALAIMGYERLSSVIAKAAEARSQDFNARLLFVQSFD
jgi:AcrR family transcriptional regulator